MADYYSQCVVQPSLPGWLVDKADRLALEGLGYTFEEDGYNWYLYARDGENSLALEINPNAWLAVFDECYPEGVQRPAWMISLVAHIQGAIAEDLALAEIEMADDKWTLDWTAIPLSGADILQGLLQKPVNTRELAVREITIEGSFSCSKFRPDGFGGWVEQITANGIRYDSTKEILERWAHEAEEGPEDTLLEAAKTVLANWEHGDLAAAVRRLTEAVQDAQTK